VAAETVITVLRLGGGDRKGHDYDQNVTRLQLGETAASAVRRTRRHEIRIRPHIGGSSLKISYNTTWLCRSLRPKLPTRFSTLDQNLDLQLQALKNWIPR
jgi:hypothetical protein